LRFAQVVLQKRRARLRERSRTSPSQPSSLQTANRECSSARITSTIAIAAPAAVVAWLWLREGQRPSRLTLAGAGLAALGLVLDLLSGADLAPGGSLAGVLPLRATSEAPVLAGTTVGWWLPVLGLGVVTAGLA